MGIDFGGGHPHHEDPFSNAEVDYILGADTPYVRLTEPDSFYDSNSQVPSADTGAEFVRPCDLPLPDTPREMTEPVASTLLIRAETQSRLDRLAEQGITEVSWKGAAIVAGALHPAGYAAVKIAHYAVDIGRAISGVNSGEGFAYKVQLWESPIFMIGLSFVVRQCSDSRQGGDFDFRLDVNAFDPLAFDALDVSAGDWAERVAALPEPRWAGEWTVPYGMEGVRNHGLVLQCAYLWRAEQPVPTPGTDWHHV